MSTGRINQARGEAERRAVADWYRKAGLTVVNFSRPGIAAGKRGHRGTMTTPGWPDLIVMDLRAPQFLELVNGEWWVAGCFAHEVKAGDARLTRVQADMKARLVAVGIRVLVGGVEVAKAELRRRGHLVWSRMGYVLRPVVVARTDAPASFTHTEVAE